MTPDIREIVSPILGKPYSEYNCWGLARHLVYEGFGIKLDESPENNYRLVSEVWFQDDQASVAEIVQPWDFFVLATHRSFGDHLGIIVDSELFVHTRERLGVCLEPIQRWHRLCLQLLRLSRLQSAS